MLNTLHVSSGIKAALLAVGVTTSAAAEIPTPAPHHVRQSAAPMTQKAILIQIDRRLGIIERAQRTMLRGYETGGIYR